MIIMLESLTILMQEYALISIILISAILSLAVTLVYKFFTNQTLMKELKQEMKKMQERMKVSKDQSEIAKLQKQSMSTNMKLMKESFKPMLITILPFFAIFAWLKSIYAGMTIIPLSFHIPLSSLETGVGWIGTYILLSLIFSTVFRKLFKVT